jgi:hypothetical protein
MGPKVCVVIPCFNHGKYIDEAIQSIQHQTFQDFEIIVIDDGSTDDFTSNKLKSIIYPNTKVIFQKNSGPVKARNEAIKISKAEYILPLDADDYFEKSFLEKAVEILENQPQVGAVNCYLKGFGFSDFTIRPKEGGIENFVTHNNACVSLLFRRICWEQVGGYNEKMKDGSEDWDFWLSVIEKGWNIYIIPETLFHYRRHEISRDVIARREKNPFIMRNLVSNHINLYREYILKYVFEKELEIMQNRKDFEASRLKIYNSIEYKIGRVILKPFRIIRKVLRKKVL